MARKKTDWSKLFARVFGVARKAGGLKYMINKLFVIGAGILALGGILLVVPAILWGPIGFSVTVVLLLGIPIFYVVMSFTVIGANEKAGKIRLGAPLKGSFLTSGPTFVWRILERVKIFTTEPVLLNLGEVNAFSKKTLRHQAAKLSANLSIWFFWPDDDDLIKIIKLVPRPYDLEAVANILRRDCIELAKEILSRLDWETAYANRNRKIDVNVEKDLEQLSTEHILRQLLLKNVEFQITDVHVVPEGLTTAPAQKEIEEHQKAARIISAEGRKREAELVGEGQAHSVRKKVEAMGGPESAVFTKSETAPDGTETVTIGGIPQSGLGEALGAIGNVFGALRKETKTPKKESVPIENEDTK